MRAKRSSIFIGVLALVAAVAVVASPASAATTTQWATWQPLTGTGGAFATSVQITPDPTMTANVTSDSRAGQVGVISGASTWLSEGTPVGAKYGSSRDQPYLNLRPKADTPTGASTTTYAFQNPTPTAGWTFVLGDIDADSVRIQAIGPDGQALTADQLGFRGGFNYCAPGITGKPSCTGSATDVPTWDETTLTLTGNAAAIDTSGAAAWFEPEAPITTLSFIFTRRSGLPVYQTWFASLARDISGAVVDDGAVPQAGVQLTLTDANGRVVASTATATDGTYSFPGVLGSDGYTVRVTAPEGQIAEGGSTRPVNLSETDAVYVDFVVRDIIPVAVSGRVVDGNGDGVGGVTVVVDGTELTAVTGSDGRYLFDRVEPGDYDVRVVTPGGFSTDDDTRAISVPEDTEEPITIPAEDDFVLIENADLGGVVTSPATGLGVAGAVVTVTDADGNIVATTVTRPLGEYTIPRLPAGEYTVTITPPNGYAPLGPISATVSLEADDLTDVNFELAVLGSFSGTVRDSSGAPVAGVVLTLEGPGGTQQLVSAEDGTYSLGGLAPGDYVLTVIPPEGTQAVDFARRSFGFPPQGGGTVVAQDFALAAVEVEPSPSPDPDPPTTPTVPAPGPGTGGAGTGTLPGTGLGPETFVWAAGGAVVLLLGATLLIVSRRRARGRDEG
ncbi:collagen binding domain-containing protein [Microbacterium sp. NPDC090225]|uniref:MSCRAMM family protein n=1 Tax=Microbacterium sp. NPDC090225 TaxID=3364207 RepID=UPI00380C61B8